MLLTGQRIGKPYQEQRCILPGRKPGDEARQAFPAPHEITAPDDAVGIIESCRRIDGHVFRPELFPFPESLQGRIVLLQDIERLAQTVTGQGTDRRLPGAEYLEELLSLGRLTLVQSSFADHEQFCVLLGNNCQQFPAVCREKGEYRLERRIEFLDKFSGTIPDRLAVLIHGRRPRSGFRSYVHQQQVHIPDPERMNFRLPLPCPYRHPQVFTIGRNSDPVDKAVAVIPEPFKKSSAGLLKRNGNFLFNHRQAVLRRLVQGKGNSGMIRMGFHRDLDQP